MGASAFMIGLVMASFPFGATLVRPLVGAYIDRLGSKLFLIGGLIIFITAATGYIWTASVLVALLLRTYHGFGWSGCTTSVGTLVADIAPDNRRGTLISYSGALSTVAGAVAPAIAFDLVESRGFRCCFSAQRRWRGWEIAGGGVDSRAGAGPGRGPAAALVRQLHPAGIPHARGQHVSLLGVSRGSVIAFLSLYALDVGLENPGHWFAVFAVAVVAGRPIIGPLSDRKGRPFVIIPCYMLALAGMVVLSLAGSPTMLLVSASSWGSVTAPPTRRS